MAEWQRQTKQRIEQLQGVISSMTEEGRKQDAVLSNQLDLRRGDFS